jgi:putative flippase GtrA
MKQNSDIGIGAEIAKAVTNPKNIVFLKKLLPSFIKYFFVGLFCALVNWSLFYVLDTKLNVFYLLAASMSYVTGTLLNFTLSCVIFKHKENRKKRTAFVMILFSDAIGLTIDLAVTALCVEIFGFPKIISKITGTGVAFVFNFTSRQFFVFSHTRK